MEETKNYNYYIEQKTMIEHILQSCLVSKKLFEKSTENQKLTKYDIESKKDIDAKYNYWVSVYNKIMTDFRKYIFNIEPDENISKLITFNKDCFVNKNKEKYINWLNRNWDRKKQKRKVKLNELLCRKKRKSSWNLQYLE